MVKILNKISDTVNEKCKVVCAVMLAYLAVVCTLQVICRRFLNSSLTWSEETMRYVFVWMILIGTAVTIKEGSAAAIDLVKNKLKNEKKRAVQEVIVFTLTGITAFILAKNGVTYAASAASVTSPAVHIPMSLVYASIPVGSFITLLHCVNGVASAIMVLSGKNKTAAEEKEAE